MLPVVALSLVAFARRRARSAERLASARPGPCWPLLIAGGGVPCAAAAGLSARRLGAAARPRPARRRAVGGDAADRGGRHRRDRRLRACRVPDARRGGRGARALRVLDACCWRLGRAEHGASSARTCSISIVALELLTFAAVPLVCLDGRAETSRPPCAICCSRSLGSVLYLLGTALLYGAYGTLDIVCCPVASRPSRCHRAASLMTAGLLAKTALFPLHLWLPPAHAGAPAAGSAVLSALVVKGSFFLVVRLWFDVMPAVPGCRGRRSPRRAGRGGDPVRQRPGAATGAAEAADRLLDGGADRLSLPHVPACAAPARARPGAACAWTGGVLQAGVACLRQGRDVHGGRLIAEALGHDRIAGLGGAGRALPISVFAFGLGRLVADGRAAERRLRGQVAAADGRRRDGAMVVGDGDAGRRGCWQAAMCSAC